MKTISSLFKSIRWMLSAAAVLALPPIVGRAAAADAPAWLGPTAVVASADGTRLFTALSDAKRVCVVDTSSRKVIAKVALPGEPTSLALDHRSNRLFAACGGADGVVCVIDPAAVRVIRTIPVGHTPTGLAVSPDGSRIYVCNRFNNHVSILSLPDGKELSRIAVTREPVGVALSPDGKTAFVINHLPAGKADGDAPPAAVVTVIATDGLKVADLRLPNGSSSLRGVCVSPDGRFAFVTHVLSRSALPTTQLERGWMNTNALTVLDLRQKESAGTVLLDDVDLGAANPWGAACSADGKILCVSHAGSHEVSVIDLASLTTKLLGLKASVGAANAAQPPALWKPIPAEWGRCPKVDASAVSAARDPVNDLAFLVGIRLRAALQGNGPRHLAVVGDKAYVAMYFSDGLAVVDLKNPAKAAGFIPLGPEVKPTLARRGEMLFHDATLCFQHWQSCATCHPDGRADSLNWDLMNDDLGNPKNTKNMLLAHRTPPAMSESVRESAETAVRAGFEKILFTKRPETEAVAVDEYLKAMQPTPSPHLVDGKLSAAAQRGKTLFFSSRAGCAECHPAPLFTDMKAHNVGSRGPYDHTDAFDTPTLIESWRTSPYLHDGSYDSIKELITKGKHGKSVGNVDGLKEDELNDLVEYVLSL